MSRISIVIPCFNYGDSLGATLESVLAQDDPDWEAIVVDDGSSDSTPEVGKEWAAGHPGHIQYIAQANAGPGAARNRGARGASGEWLLFLDADDVLLPGALVRYRRAVAASPQASLVIAGAETLRNGVVVDTRRAAPAGADRIRNFAAFVRGELCPFNGGAIMLHRRVMDRLHYPENIRTSEDYVFFAQAFSLFDCASAVEPAVAMHRHPGSLRYNRSALESAREVMIDLLFDPQVLPEKAMRYRNEVESTWCLTVSRAYYMHRRYRDAARYYRRAVRLYPRNLLRSSYLRKFLVSTVKSAAGAKGG
ncbi:MAG TPA: glycosyltransferase family 2 protein [Arenicellales bacterium]|nr:glycosyltransferase family 2 protein [Arenicellales bacterium]